MHPFAHKGRSELIPLEQNRRGFLRYQSQHKHSHPHGRNKVIPSVTEFLTVSTHTLTICRLGVISRGSKVFTKKFFFRRIINVVGYLYVSYHSGVLAFFVAIHVGKPLR
jgi:hypothetical protein